MSDIQAQITALLAQRADIDTQLESLRAEAMKELEAARAKVAEIDACLKVRPQTPAVQVASTEQPDECDGIGPEESDGSGEYHEFVDELKAIREHNLSRRRRRA